MVRALGGGRGAGAHAGTPSSQLPQGRGQGAARTARGEEGADGRAVTLARSLPPRAQRAAGGVDARAARGRVGGLLFLARRASAVCKRPPPLTPPRHSLSRM